MDASFGARRVLFYIAACPDSTVRDIALGLGATERTVRSALTDPKRAGILSVRREGLREHFTVNLAAPFYHPSIHSLTLRSVLPQIVALAKRAPPDFCVDRGRLRAGETAGRPQISAHQ